MKNKLNNKPKKSAANDAKKRKKLNTPTASKTKITKKATDNSKLKKTLIIASIALAAVVAIVLSAVLIFNNSAVGKLLTQLKDGENYHMTATVSGIPLVGSLSFEQKVDGNISYTSSFLLTPERYKEVVGDETYIYTQNSSGKWTKTKSEGNSNSVNDMIEDLIGDLDDLTNPKNYKKISGEKNKYQQKANVEFENCRDVIITIENDKITVEMTINFAGSDLPATIVISNIGKVDLMLPEVE